MSRNRRRAPLEKLREYCNTATVHGMGYIFGDGFKVYEHIFWLLTTLTMLVIASKLINDMNIEWINNPKELKISTRTYKLDEIQSPAITICHNFMPDRWGFLRNLLNLAEFECHSPHDCKNTTSVRGLFVNNYIQAGFANSEIRSRKFPEDFATLIANSWAKINFSDIKTVTDSESWATSVLNHEALGIRAKLKEKNKDLGYEYMFSAIKRKMAGKMNNNDFYKEIGMNYRPESMFEFGDIDIISAIPVLAFLMMPMPGRLGTMAANFLREDPRTSVWSISDWLYPVGPEDTLNFGFHPPERPETSGFLANIIDVMSMKKGFNVSALDIGPIFAPVPNFNTSRKYSLQFRYTLAKHWELNGFKKNYLSRDNYFGKLFTGQLTTIMEVMYHNMLKPQPVRKQWTLHPLYKNLKKMMPFQLNDTAVVRPTIKDDFGRLEGYPYLPLRYVLDGHYESYYFSQDDWDISSKNLWYTKGFNPSPIKSYEAMDKELESLRQKYYHRQMLLHCTGPDKVDCTSMFQPVVTDKGICYSLNALDFGEAMKNSTNYVRTFSGIFDPKSQGTDMGNLSSSYKIFLILNNGQSEIFDPQNGHFTVGITNRHNFMGILDKEVTVSAGYHLDVKIDPHKCDSTVEFQSLTPEQRECRYHHEFDNASIFMYYSREACRYECRLKESLTRCGCTPWNYPMPDNNATLCDGVGAFCFERAMRSSVNFSSCPCTQDCNELNFDTRYSRFKINSNIECQDTAMGEYDEINAHFKRNPELREDYDLVTLVSEMIRNKEGEEFKFWIDKWFSLPSKDKFSVHEYFKDMYVRNHYIKYLNPEVTLSKCKDMVDRNFAYVTIELTGHSPQVCVKDISVTFLEKISMLGGTIGLFTGASLLSLVEAGFWLSKIMAEFRQRR